jgi:hypothetical protein
MTAEVIAYTLTVSLILCLCLFGVMAEILQGEDDTDV